MGLTPEEPRGCTDATTCVQTSSLSRDRQPVAAVLSGNRDIALRSAAVWLSVAPASCPVLARHLSTAQARSEESRNGPSVDRIELDASSASTTSKRTDVAPPSASAKALLTGGTLSGASQSNRLWPWSSSGDSPSRAAQAGLAYRITPPSPRTAIGSRPASSSARKSSAARCSMPERVSRLTVMVGARVGWPAVRRRSRELYRESHRTRATDRVARCQSCSPPSGPQRPGCRRMRVEAFGRNRAT